MTIRTCRRCHLVVKAEWMWVHPHPALVILTLLSCGLLLPLLIFAPKSHYVCPHYLNKV